MKIKNIVNISIFFLCIQILFADLRNFEFDHLGTEDGLASDNITAIFQDSQGFIWIGSFNGINRYDGCEIKQYTLESNFHYEHNNDAVRSILEDSEGKIWIATNKNGIQIYDPESENFTHLFHDADDSGSISSRFISSMIKDGSGNIWFSTERGLSLFNSSDSTFTNYNFDEYFSDSNTSYAITSIYEDNNNVFWVGTPGGLYIFDRKSKTFIQPVDSEMSLFYKKIKYPQVFFEDQENNLWIGTRYRGLFQFDRKNDLVKHFLQDKKNGLSNNNIHGIIQDKYDNIWISTVGSGINIYNLKTKRFNHIIKIPNNPKSLSNNMVSPLFKDRNNMIWAGTFGGGLNKYNSSKVQFITLNDYLSDEIKINKKNAFSFCEDKKGNLWIGKSDGIGYFDREKNRWEYHPIEPIYTGKIVAKSLCLDEENNLLWVGTIGDGLIKYNIKTKEQTFFRLDFDSTDSSLSNFASSMINYKNYLWIGSHSGNLYKFDKTTETFRLYKIYKNSNILDLTIKKLLVDHDDILWIGTHKGGLFSLDLKTEKLTNFNDYKTEDKTKKFGIILSLYQDNDENLWIGTTSGLIKYNKENKFGESYLTKDTYGANVIRSIEQDNYNRLWIGTNKGLFCLDLKKNTTTGFFQKDGLSSEHFFINSSIKTNDDKLVFGTIAGAIYFDPDKIEEHLEPPIVKITGLDLYYQPVEVNKKYRNRVILEKSITHTKKVILYHNENMLQIKFAALHYTNPQKNQYAYKMTGLDTGYHFIDNQNHVSFSYLKPGKYRFHLKAANSNNVWNEDGQCLEIIIKHPWWKTPLSITVEIFLFLSAIVVVFRYRTGKIKQRNEELNSYNQKLAQEIRDRKQAQKYIKNIIDSMDSVIIGIDAEFNITQWNSSAHRVTGISAEEAHDKNLNEAFPMLKEESDFIQSSIKKEMVQRVTKKIIEKNANKHFDITIYPLIEQTSTGAVIRIDDVTEIKMLENMMIQSEKMLSIGGLAAGMAHEINNPLAGILQNLQVIRNRLTKKLPQNIKSAEKFGLEIEQIYNYICDRKIDVLIERLNDSAKRAADIVKNMLSFARKEDDNKKVEVELPKLVDETLGLLINDYDMKKKYDFRKVEIIKNYQNAILVTACNPTQIQQVLLNILKNGAEAMAEQKNKTEKSMFMIDIYREDNWVLIEIKDNGPGMEETTQSRIFEPFYTTKDVGKGTGLGLSVSYFIITENHDGYLYVKSNQGQGTTFVIKLPVVNTPFFNKKIQ